MNSTASAFGSIFSQQSCGKLDPVGSSLRPMIAAARSFAIASRLWWWLPIPVSLPFQQPHSATSSSAPQAECGVASRIGRALSPGLARSFRCAERYSAAPIATCGISPLHSRGFDGKGGEPRTLLPSVVCSLPRDRHPADCHVTAARATRVARRSYLTVVGSIVSRALRVRRRRHPPYGSLACWLHDTLARCPLLCHLIHGPEMAIWPGLTAMTTAECHIVTLCTVLSRGDAATAGLQPPAHPHFGSNTERARQGDSPCRGLGVAYHTTTICHHPR